MRHMKFRSVMTKKGSLWRMLNEVDDPEPADLLAEFQAVVRTAIGAGYEMASSGASRPRRTL